MVSAHTERYFYYCYCTVSQRFFTYVELVKLRFDVDIASRKQDGFAKVINGYKTGIIYSDRFSAS